MLAAQKPYPAFALDRYWNMVASNGALPHLYDGVAHELLQPPVNALRISLHSIRTQAGVLSFISTTAVFGSPVDVTLAELAIESFYPADRATEQAVRVSS